MNPLSGKVVAITGGGTGIGAGIARGLAEAGCRVTIGGRRLAPLEELAGSVESEHSIQCQTIDVANPDSVSKFFEQSFAHVCSFRIRSPKCCTIFL